MLPTSILVPWVVLQAATLTPASVPAHGKAEATLKVDVTGYVRVRATSASGTACELIDPLRGPFVSNGRVGRRSCDLNLLLDAGTYRVRLTSPRKGKGAVALSAVSFTEQNSSLSTLAEGGAIESVVPEGTQASVGFKVPEGTPSVLLHVVGRTAGQVALWRGGEFVESAGWSDTTTYWGPGQPVHDAWLSVQLEPGDYRLTAYGTSAWSWSSGGTDNRVVFARGARPVQAQGVETSVLPTSGFWAVHVPKGRTVGFLSTPNEPSSALEVGAYETTTEADLVHIEPQSPRCRIPAKAVWHSCGFLSGLSTDSSNVLWVRGAPGTPFTVRWAPYIDSAPSATGIYGQSVSAVRFVGASTGRYLLSVDDLPAQNDAAPQGCILSHEAEPRPVWMGSDVPLLRGDAPLTRSFNYDGSRLVLDFEVQTAGRYRIATSGQRKSRCELYNLVGAGAQKLTDGERRSCTLDLSLSAGPHQLVLHGGTTGIETLRVIPGTPAHSPPLKEDVKEGWAKTGCLFPEIVLEVGQGYLLELTQSSGPALRGVHVRALPLVMDAPLPIELTAGRKISLPIAAGQSVRVQLLDGNGWRCGWEGGSQTEVKDGVCAPAPRGQVSNLRLESTSSESLQLLVGPPTPAVPPVTAPRFDVHPMSVASLQLDQASGIELARSASQSRIFEVKEAGLYEVATEGLLATHCRLRTPVISELAEDTSGGRGRNCRMDAYLRPGRYLVTAQALNQSKGHAAIRVTRRPEKVAEAISGQGDAFFPSDAEELTQEKISIPSAGKYRLATLSTSGAPLSCRLEDSQGWPVVKVPSACDLTLPLAAGEYRWLQLPSTVETQRRTELAKIVPPEIFNGNRPHSVSINQPYTAELGKDGKDEFLFSLTGNASLKVVLTNGMQGRIFAAGDRGWTDLKGSVAPSAAAAARVQEEPSEDETIAQEPSEGEENNEGDWNDLREGEPAAAAATAPPPTDPIPDAPEQSGQPLDLKAGEYRLVAQHSQGDAAIRYQLQINSAVLLPGMSRELPVPSRVPIQIPAGGIVRISTEGNAAVHCLVSRGSAGARKVLAQSADRGADWNCALSQPLPSGDALLTLDSTSGLKGTTTVHVEMPRLQEASLPANGEWKITDAVLRAPVTALPEMNVQWPQGDAVAWIELSAQAAFNCALENPTGQIVQQITDTRRCDLRVAPHGQGYWVRTWTSAHPALVSVKSHLFLNNEVARVTVDHAGLYRSSEGMFCTAYSSLEGLHPCGPQISLEKGVYLFVSDRLDKPPVRSLNEEVVSLDRPFSERRILSSTPFIQNQRTGAPALHVLSVLALPGAATAPVCRVSGGVDAHSPLGCFAASSVTTTSEARAWNASATEPADVVQRSFELPRERSALVPGTQSVHWKTPVLRSTMPAPAFRVEWTLLPDAWALLLDDAGKALDLCPPNSELNQCSLVGKGGEVVVYSPRDARAEAQLTLMDALPPTRQLAYLYEEIPTTSGVLRFETPQMFVPMHLEITGAQACGLERRDGVRELSCNAMIPAHEVARVWIQHGQAPVRVLFSDSQGRADVVAGPRLDAKAADWAPDTQLPLQGTQLERTVELKGEQVLWLHSDTGVCSLSSGKNVLATDGSGQSCDLQRLLPAGRYTLRIRAFGTSEPIALRGAARWGTHPLEELREGVAAERWIGPGEARYFRFQTASAGKIGLGLQSNSDDLDCAVLDAQQHTLADGCQQLASLPQGSFLLTIRSSPESKPQRFRPVLLGLAGAKSVVPREYLESFFDRIGDNQ